MGDLEENILKKAAHISKGFHGEANVCHRNIHKLNHNIGYNVWVNSVAYF